MAAPPGFGGYGMNASNSNAFFGGSAPPQMFNQYASMQQMPAQ